MNDGTDSDYSNGLNGDHVKLAGARATLMSNGEYSLDGAPFGGNQSEQGYLFGRTYLAGSIRDNLLESFAGPHDWISSVFYDSAGNQLAWTQSGFGAIVSNIYEGLALFPAAAFAGMSQAPELAFEKGRHN